MRDNLRSKLSKGKFFYTLLAVLVAFILIPVSAALIVCLNSLHHAGIMEQATLSITIDSQIQYSQTVSPARECSVKAEKLKSESTLFTALGGLDTLAHSADLERAEQLLLAVSDTDLSELRSSYLYFQNSDYVMDIKMPGTNTRNNISSAVLKIIKEIPELKADYPYNQYGVDENNEYYAAFVSAISPGVYFIHFRSYGPDGMPDTYLSESLKNLLTNYEVTYYDSFGNYLPMTEQQTLIQMYDYDSLGNENIGSFSFVNGKKSYLCYYFYNADNHTKYALYCEDRIGESQRIAVLFLCVGAVCVLAICLAYAIVFIKKTYRPLDVLVSRLPQGKNDVIRDDCRILSNAFDSMEAKIREQKHMLARTCLLRRLKGQSTYGYEDCLPDTLTEDSGDTIVAAAVRVDAAENGEYPTGGDFESAVLNSFCKAGYTLYSVWEDDLLFVVFRLVKKDYGELMSEIVRQQEKIRNLSISIYISAPHKSVRELPRAYDEVRAVAEYCTLMEKYGVALSYDAIPQTIQSRGSTAPDYYLQLKQLSDCCAALMVEEALLQYDALIFQFSERAGRSLKKEDMEFSILVDTIALAFYNIALPGDINKKVIKCYVEQIKSAQSTALLRRIMKTCLAKFRGPNDNQNLEEKRFEQIKAFIEQNFKDQNLCSASVADRFETSPSNISRIFKKYNQTGFLEYVHQLRVSKAARLLEDTNLPVADIALQVGYTNVITMFRAFKSYAHATPGAIRKLHASEKSLEGM